MILFSDGFVSAKCIRDLLVDVKQEDRCLSGTSQETDIEEDYHRVGL